MLVDKINYKENLNVWFNWWVGERILKLIVVDEIIILCFNFDIWFECE